MAFGLDYVTGPSVADLKSAGVTFVCRYLSYANDLTKIKLLTKDEATALSQASIAIISNYEWYANRALEGAASGIQDAQIADTQHKACGGPTDRPIYFSVDVDVDGSQVADYFRGVASIIGLPRTAAYGSYRVIKYLFDNNLIAYGWQTYAWSNGAWENRANIQQYSNSMILAGFSVDYNRSITNDFGQWLQGQGVTMQTYNTASADFSTWFTATDSDHWTCKQTNQTIQFGIKGFYAQLSLDGQSLPILGLPVTGEQYFTVNGQNVVFQGFERGAIGYDPTHSKDSQPGTGDCFLFHLTDSDFLTRYPGLSLPATSIDTTALAAAINAIPDAVAKAVATSVAAALIEAKKL